MVWFSRREEIVWMAKPIMKRLFRSLRSSVIHPCVMKRRLFTLISSRQHRPSSVCRCPPPRPMFGQSLNTNCFVARSNNHPWSPPSTAFHQMLHRSSQDMILVNYLSLTSSVPEKDLMHDWGVS